jgi:hypothetical protein
MFSSELFNFKRADSLLDFFLLQNAAVFISEHSEIKQDFFL